jgi:hypothetical protein
MNGGAPLDPKLNPYPNNTPLNLAFAAGYTAGQADWQDKNAPSDDA